MEKHHGVDGAEAVWVSVAGSEKMELIFDQWCAIDRQLDGIIDRLKDGNHSYKVGVGRRVLSQGEMEDGIMTIL